MKKYALMFGLMILLMSLSGCNPGSPVSNRATIFLASKFGGHHVDIYVDDEVFFSGRVLTDDSSQLAASIQIRPNTPAFRLQIKLNSPATGPLFLQQEVNCNKGVFFTVFLVGKELKIQQDLTKPDFY